MPFSRDADLSSRLSGPDKAHPVIAGLLSEGSPVTVGTFLLMNHADEAYVPGAEDFVDYPPVMLEAFGVEVG